MQEWRGQCCNSWPSFWSTSQILSFHLKIIVTLSNYLLCSAHWVALLNLLRLRVSTKACPCLSPPFPWALLWCLGPIGISCKSWVSYDIGVWMFDRPSWISSSLGLLEGLRRYGTGFLCEILRMDDCTDGHRQLVLIWPDGKGPPVLTVDCRLLTHQPLCQALLNKQFQWLCWEQ